MLTRLVVRLLDAAGTILAWADVYAQARGDGALWLMAPFQAVGEKSGSAVTVSVHWPDINAHVLIPLEAAIPVQAQTIVTVPWGDQPILRIAPQGQYPPPPVTVRQSVAVGVPLGSLAARPT